MREYCLKKLQVARQLLNYKKGKFMNTQVSILLNPSDLDERIREGIYGRVCVINTYEDLRS